MKTMICGQEKLSLLIGFDMFYFDLATCYVYFIEYGSLPGAHVDDRLLSAYVEFSKLCKQYKISDLDVDTLGWYSGTHGLQ
jgi:hypothetical protein